MPVERVPKFDAARIQLDAAAESYLQGKFLPAITLAAAAEEVLARLLPKEHQSSQAELVALLVARLGITEKEARDVHLNGVRNALKHHSDTSEPYIELDPEVDAKVWIVRAFNNYLKLSDTLPPAVTDFIERYTPRGDAAPASKNSLERSRDR